MNQNQALVVSVEDEFVWVEIPERVAACGNCQNSKNCQTGLLDGASSMRRYRIPNAIHALPGDTVLLHINDGTLWQASFLSYLFPAILAISGAAVGQLWAEDAGALFGTLLGLVFGFSYLRRAETRGKSAHPLLSIRRLTT